MDPTFAGEMRRYLAAVIAEHRQAEAPLTGCAAGDDQLEDGSLADHVLDVITAQFAAPELAPHVVHVKKPATRLERMKTFDANRGDRKRPDGEDVVPAHRRTRLDAATGELALEDVAEVRTPYWGFDEEVRVTQPPFDCPDCSRGLVSRGRDMICPRIDRAIELAGCHDHGCLVACGTERTDG